LSKIHSRLKKILAAPHDTMKSNNDTQR
jgi:hypothetical protein